MGSETGLVAILVHIFRVKKDNLDSVPEEHFSSKEKERKKPKSSDYLEIKR